MKASPALAVPVAALIALAGGLLWWRHSASSSDDPLAGAPRGQILRSVALGKQPIGLLVDGKTQRVFVVNRGESDFSETPGSVTMLDARSGVLLGSYPFDAAALASNRSGDVVVRYTDRGANRYSGTGTVAVAMLNGQTGKSLWHTSLGKSLADAAPQARDLAVDNRSGHIFVAYRGPGGREGRLAMLDGRSGRVLRTIGLGNAYRYQVTVDSSRGRVLVAGNGPVDGWARILDAANGKPLRGTPLVGSTVRAVASPRTGRFFLITGRDTASRSLRTLDAAGGAVVRSVPLGDGPQVADALAVDDVAGRVVVLSGGTLRGPGATGSQGAVRLFDARSGALLQTVTPGGPLTSLAIDERAGRILVGGDRALTVLDTRSGKTLRTVGLGLRVQLVAVDARAGRAFVVGRGRSGEGTAIAVDTGNGSILQTVALGNGTWTDLAVVPETGRAFAINYKDGQQAGVASMLNADVP